MRFWSILQLETKNKCSEIENIQVVLIRYIQLKYIQLKCPFLKQKYVSLIVSQNVTTEQKIDLLKTCVLYLGKAVLSEGLTANLAYLNNKY